MAKFSDAKQAKSSEAKPREGTGDPVLGMRLRILRKKKGLNQEQMGVSKSLMSQYESGLTMPPVEALIGFAEKLGVTLDHLVTGDERLFSEEREYVFPKFLTDERLRAGPRGRLPSDHLEVDGRIPIPRAAIERRRWRLDRLKLLLTDGKSMYPTINDREPMVINLDEVKLISGLTFAIQEGEEGSRVKRLYDTGDGRVRVVSDNADKITYPDEFITPESQTRIVGRAYRLGDLYSDES